MRHGLTGAFAAVVLAAACDPPTVAMAVSLPSDVADQVAWIEIGAFPNGCPAGSELAGGLPPSGLADRVAFAADASPIGLGKLDSARYGFAAVARRSDCGVVAAGCSTADVSSARAVDISLDDTGNPDASACTSGLVCEGARCVPPTNGNDPNAGAGCSMVLVGAGPLPDALDGGPFVTAPAIAPLAGGGFVIAYAEYIDVDGTERLTIQPIDSGAAALTPIQKTLDGHCPGLTKIDAAGLAMGTSGGLAVVSLEPCATDGGMESGFEFFPLDATGNVLQRKVLLNKTTAPTLALSTHALTPGAANFLLATNVNGTATLLHTDGLNPPQSTLAFGTPQDLATRVVRSAGTGVVAIEADGPSVGDAGISGSVARVYLASNATDPTAIGNPVDQVPANVTALTALGTRAFLLTNGAGKGEDVAMRGYDLGGKTVPAVSGGFSAAQSTTVLALDAAAAQNRLFCALEQQDSISIAVIDGATGAAPQLLRRVDLASDIRIPKSAHDGPIAIAATQSAVAITWAAHKDGLTDGEAVGGYAVFACRP